MKGEPHSLGEGEVQGVCRQQCPGRGDHQPQPGRHSPDVQHSPLALCKCSADHHQIFRFLILGTLLH